MDDKTAPSEVETTSAADSDLDDKTAPSEVETTSAADSDFELDELDSDVDESGDAAVDDFGERLDALVMLSGRSQRQLAQAAGLDPSALSRLKKGPTRRKNEVRALGQALEAMRREELRDATMVLFGLKEVPSQRVKCATFVHFDDLMKSYGTGEAPRMNVINALGEGRRETVLKFVYASPVQDATSPKFELLAAFEDAGFEHVPLAERIEITIAEVAGDVIRADQLGVSDFVFVGFPDWLVPIVRKLRKEGNKQVDIAFAGPAPFSKLGLEGNTVHRIPAWTGGPKKEIGLTDLEKVLVDHMVSPVPEFTPKDGIYTFKYLENGLQWCNEHGEDTMTETSANELLKSCIAKGILVQAPRPDTVQRRPVWLDMTHPLVRSYLEDKTVVADEAGNTTY